MRDHYLRHKLVDNPIGYDANVEHEDGQVKVDDEKEEHLQSIECTPNW